MTKLALGCAGVAVLLLAGCSPDVRPSPSATVVGSGPSAAPSTATTPQNCPGAPGTTPTPCTPAQLEELRAKAALYAEAEQVYRKFFEEDGKLGMAGKEASGPVMDLIAGPYVESYKKQHRDSIGITADGYGTLTYVRPAPGQTHEGSDVALSVCVDGSKVTAYENGKALGPLGFMQSTYYLKRADGSLKIWWQKWTEAASC